MEVDLGFIILCPDRNVGGVRNTCGSIRHHSYNRDTMCVLPSDTTKEELEEAIESGKILHVDGIGEKTAEKFDRNL